jgi:phage/plasmid-associated DNA primase
LISADTNSQIDSQLCLSERLPAETAPLISTLLLKFQIDDEDDGNWEPYTDEFLHTLCKVYQQVLYDYFRVESENQLELLVVILESKTHWFEHDQDTGLKYMVTEIRLQFPHSRIEIELQHKLVRAKVIQLLRNQNVMAKLQRQPVADWEQIISSNVTREPVLMYGSTETPQRPKLAMTHIWSWVTEEMLEEEMEPEELALRDVFFPQNHSHVLSNTVNSSLFADQEPEYWLPLFLSVGYWPSILLLRDPTIGALELPSKINSPQHRKAGPVKAYYQAHDQSEIEISKLFLGMLSHTRFTQEIYWLDLGRALYHIHEGAEEGLSQWISCSEKSLEKIGDTPDFMKIGETLAETCQQLYSTFIDSSITLKTLAQYAKQDAPDQYTSWHQAWCEHYMEQALSSSHADVGLAFYRTYWLDFSFCPIGKGRWSYFDGKRWREDHKALRLKSLMSGDFVKRFETARAALAAQIKNSESEQFRNASETAIKKITKLIGCLKNTPFKNHIVTTATEKFSDDKFSSLLDKNPDILGVLNGVLEVNGERVYYRKAKPEDYVSMCTNIPYNQIFTWESPSVKAVMKWLSQIFTDNELRHHFLKFAASCLKGKNSDKLFNIFVGEGDNSKSMLVKLFVATFGAYCIKFDVSNVTAKNTNPSGSSPQIARAKATRIVFLDEPEDDEPIKKGVVKRWVGGDSFFSRFNYDNGGDVEVTFKMVMSCNTVPVVARADRAFKQRFTCYPFVNTWVSNPPEDEEEQYSKGLFKKDPFFERLIPLMAPAFLWILVQYFSHYALDGLTNPSAIVERTEDYWKDNDLYAQFIADNVREVLNGDGEPDKGARVTLTQIHNEFKTWFRDSFPGVRVPDRPEVRAQLITRWGKLVGNYWYGIRLLSTDVPVSTTIVGTSKFRSQAVTK